MKRIYETLTLSSLTSIIVDVTSYSWGRPRTARQQGSEVYRVRDLIRNVVAEEV
jgi:hypothetical protein